MIFRLAWKNIIGAGFRTWLNVFILSICYFAIIAVQGMFLGWQEEASQKIKLWDIAEGQYWQKDFDPYDPFTWHKSHAKIPDKIMEKNAKEKAVPVLLTWVTAYPHGRMRNVMLKGINPEQNLLILPSEYLKEKSDYIPAIMGKRTAESLKLQTGDYLTLRWKDQHGTFDATDILVRHIFKTTVLSVDSNQIWIALDQLQDMLDLPDEATLISIADAKKIQSFSDWEFKDTDYLLRDVKSMIEAKTIGSTIFYILLLFMAMIAIFDSQILSIFRRRKEIGTLMALGLTRSQVIRLFTLEGSLHAILAIGIGAIYGIPILNQLEKRGITFGMEAGEFGISGLSDRLYPIYGFKLVLITILLVLITTIIVSFIPARKITKLKPTDVLKGKFNYSKRN